jgi:large subunit ribosomal protein L17
MRHRKAGKELGRNPSHRRAMLRNMVTSLFKYQQIVTTDAKAKALRPVAEKMITLAKRGDLHARRQALAYIQDKEVTHRLFDEIKDRYLDRQGGYVRVIKKSTRKGDGAPISIIQLLPLEEGKTPGKKKAKKAKTGKTGGTKSEKKAKAKKISRDSSGDVAVGKEEKGEVELQDNKAPNKRKNG